MAISYVWDVSNCDAYPTKSGKSNVVTCVHWRLKAIDGSNNDSDGNPHIAEVYGAQHLDTSDLSSFTNFSTNSIIMCVFVYNKIITYKTRKIL